MTKTIKCGNCKATHESVGGVRNCYANAGKITNPTPASSKFEAQRQAVVQQEAPAATDKQVAFLTKLCEERPMWANVENLHADRIPKLTKADASAKIKEALEVPKEKQVQQNGKVEVPTVPAGHYAIPSATGNNDLDFFRVDRPDKGKYQGMTFVKRIVGGHPEFGLKFKPMVEVLNRIVEAGPEQARQLYGQEIGRCWKCNRTLTDELSRQLGIGPVCREAL